MDLRQNMDGHSPVCNGKRQKKKIRLLRQYDRSVDGSSLENETLMNDNDKTDRNDDSDVEQTVSRLCQYLTTSPSNSENDEELLDEDTIVGPSNRSPPLKNGFLSSQCLKNSKDSVISSENNLSERSTTMELDTNNSNNNRGVYFRRVPPPDFLNIPPPAHPPEESPTNERRPLPPNRTLPPVPVNEEPQYEEAKPPPPAPRLSKQNRRENSYQRSPISMNNNLSSGHCYMNEDKPLYISQGSQYNDVDCNSYETSILERNETGSFYVPSSGHTTMSNISPSRKSEMLEQQNRHNYSLLPTGQTTVPVPVLPMRPQLNSNCSSPKKHKKSKFYCSWKILTYSLAAGLIFALAVICYLLVNLFTTSGSNSKNRDTQNSLIELNSVNPTVSSALLPLRPLPEYFEIGDRIITDLPPGVIRRTSFNVQRNSYVQFNLSVDPQAKLALYGRQTVPPSPTEHDFAQIILGAKLHASSSSIAKRSPASGKPYGYNYPDQNLRSTTFVHYLLEGRWHLALLNDDTSVSVVRFSTYLTEEETKDCKYNCYEKGVCNDGKCFCFHGYSGAYCEETVCPVLCSGNGIFTSGKCHCHQGWKGSDCNVPSNVCEILNCNKHGHCNTHGECACDKGYKGKFCEELDCPNTNCSNHGVCVDGKCFCDFGWRGESCEMSYTSGELCPVPSSAECSNRGSYDRSTKKCVCEFGFIGEKCEKSVCNFDCGSHGRCENHHCVCEDGWTGAKCAAMLCGAGCENHGACNNGTCICHDGWNGENCLLDGCPKNCHGHGQCQKVNSHWQCSCDSSFAGPECSIPLESQCSDKLDNDGDMLTDCEDSECCSLATCQGNTLCQTVPDPHQVLIRMQAPPPQSSFFQKTRFLLDADSLQHYSDFNLFNESRAAVIRGRTVNNKGGALIGVRVVDMANALYGFTLSRNGGWFDLMVNGGGSVTLHFMRLPFGSAFKTVAVPWNEIVYIGDIVMSTKPTLDDEKDSVISTEQCTNTQRLHNIQPFFVPSWHFASLGQAVGLSGAVVDAEAVQESLKVPGTDLYLTYFSANTPGHYSTLTCLLVPAKFHRNLRLVTLIIDVEGVHFKRTFEAKSNLTFTYGWDMSNIFKQKVYGLTVANVAVGYFYSGCPVAVWEKRKIPLSGHRSSISDLGGWNLNIHHRYDVLNGVVEKGDGSALYLKQQPPLLQTILNNDIVKQKLSQNNGNGKESSSFLPVALAVAKDGGLFIGDQNSVKLLTPSGALHVAIELNPAYTAHQYYLAVNPVTSDLYISLALKRQIWRVRGNVSTKASTFTDHDIVAGTGESCLFDDDCGDGGPAESAKLNFPKGMAFDSQGNLYIADERKIRWISTDGLMSTLIGETKKNVDTWRPLECKTEFPADLLRLQWPTHVVTNPVNDKVLFLDSDSVFELTLANHVTTNVRLVAGNVSPSCRLLTSAADNSTVRPISLKNAQAIQVTKLGQLVVAETDGRRVHRIRILDEFSRQIRLLVGAESNCDCSKNCPCDDTGDLVLARNARLNRPVALSVDYQDKIHIADQGNQKIRTVRVAEPQFDNYYRTYDVLSPEHQEVYLFNRFGQHVATRDLITDRYVYNFTYHVDSSYGALVHVTSGQGDRRLLIGRKDRYKISLENADGLKSVVQVSRFNQMIEKFVAPDGCTFRYQYDRSNNGLLISKFDCEERAWFYDYNDNGHLIGFSTPFGDSYQLENRLINDRKVEFLVRKNDNVQSKFIVGDNEIDISSASIGKSIFLQEGGIYHLNTKDGVTVQYDSGTHSLLEAYQSAILRRKLFVPAATELSRKELVSTLEWRYHLRKTGRENRKRVAQVGRKTRINGVNLLNIEYDRDSNVDTLFSQNNAKLLEIHYNHLGDVLYWKPMQLSIAPMNLSYDNLGRLTNLHWGSVNQSYVYDTIGRLSQVKYHESSSQKNKKFTYANDSAQPIIVELQFGNKYHIIYDKSGFLSKIVTPLSRQHSYLKYNDLDSLNYVYSWRRAKNDNDWDESFMMSKNFDGTISYWRYPSGEKSVFFDYSDNKLLTNIYHDDCHVTFDYGDNEKYANLLPKEITINVTDRMITKKYSAYQGNFPVVISERRTVFDNSNVANVEASFAYQYDDNLRLISVQCSVEGVGLQPIEVDYDGFTGRVIRTSNYRHEYFDNNNKLRTFDDRSSLEITLSSLSQIAHTKFSVQSRTVYEQRLYYDSQGRLSSVNQLIANSDEYAYTYDYDVTGRLSNTKIKRNNEIFYSYQYDLDGNVKNLNNLSVIYDSDSGMLKQLGPLKYKFDSNGFLTKRGEFDFYYDSYGRLIAARQKSPNFVDNRYFYDENHRVIAWQRANKWYHFWYARLDKPRLITHMLEVSTNLITVFVYDRFDRLFAFERAGAMNYVLSRPDLTTEFVFAQDGSLVTWIYRSPFGEIIQTTLSDFTLPIGFKGQFHDEDCNVVIFSETGRPYDSLSGRWMTIQMQNIFEEISLNNPEVVNYHIFNNNDPVNAELLIPGSVEQWTTVLGHNLKTFMPMLTPSQGPTFSCFQGDRLITLAGECDLKKKVEKFHSFNSAAKSSLSYTSRINAHPQITPCNFVYGADVIISNNSGRISTKFVENSENSAEINTKHIVGVLLNDSRIIPLKLISNGKSTEFYWKPGGVKRFDQDLQKFGLSQDERERLVNLLPQDLNITVTDSSSKNQLDLQVTGRLGSVHLHYGGDEQDETSRILRFVSSRMENVAWTTEYNRAIEGRLTRHNWTETETVELLAKGKIEAYTVKYIRDPLRHPKMATDPNNLRFMKRN